MWQQSPSTDCCQRSHCFCWTILPDPPPAPTTWLIYPLSPTCSKGVGWSTVLTFAISCVPTSSMKNPVHILPLAYSQTPAAVRHLSVQLPTTEPFIVFTPVDHVETYWAHYIVGHLTAETGTRHIFSTNMRHRVKFYHLFSRSIAVVKRQYFSTNAVKRGHKWWRGCPALPSSSNYYTWPLTHGWVPEPEEVGHLQLGVHQRDCLDSQGYHTTVNQRDCLDSQGYHTTIHNSEEDKCMATLKMEFTLYLCTLNY